MTAGLPETATSVGAQIGRYFSLASLLPSLIFVTWCLALQGIAAPFGDAALSGGADALSDWSLEKFGLVVAASLLLGFIVHPLMFPTTQLFEGYWGHRRFAVRVATALALRHRARQDQLEDDLAAAGRRLRGALDEMSLREFTQAELGDMTDVERKQLRARLQASPKAVHLHQDVLARDFLNMALEGLPSRSDRILPTRLGNALRRVEDEIGQQYGLDLITIAPHLATAASPARAAYVDDAREQLDVAVRLAFYGLLAAGISAVWLIGSGWGLLIALVPYAFGYMSYRGAVSAAEEWGAAVATCVDLDRFALYESMRAERPQDTVAERERNRELMKLLAGDRQASVTYRQQPN